MLSIYANALARPKETPAKSGQQFERPEPGPVRSRFLWVAWEAIVFQAVLDANPLRKQIEAKGLFGLQVHFCASHIPATTCANLTTSAHQS